ncbi:MAG: hypothetical protein GC136_05670 [Alphaproteobacteria bacterium]|nr:hypothetical protein [Alphaproteobacteria bacterium]
MPKGYKMRESKKSISLMLAAAFFLFQLWAILAPSTANAVVNNCSATRFTSSVCTAQDCIGGPISWNVSGSTCNGTVVTTAPGDITATITDSTVPTLGTSKFRCMLDGTFEPVSPVCETQTAGVCAAFGASGSQPANASNGCTTGTYGDTADTTANWGWQCVGPAGGATTPCTSAKATCSGAVTWTVSGATCNGTATSTASGSNSSSVTSTGPGSGSAQFACANGVLTVIGGATCTNAPVAGACKSHTGYYASQPASDNASGCTAGTYADSGDGTSQWGWKCNGLNGGANVTCNANKQRCSGAVTWTVSGSTCNATAPNTDSGSNASVTDSGAPTLGSATFACTNGTLGVTGTPTCTSEPVNGSCGSSKNGTFATEPSTNLCTEGTPSAVSANGLYWVWRCDGINGGLSRECTANNSNCTNWSWTGLAKRGAHYRTYTNTFAGNPADVYLTGAQCQTYGIYCTQATYGFSCSHDGTHLFNLSRSVVNELVTVVANYDSSQYMPSAVRSASFYKGAGHVQFVNTPAVEAMTIPNQQGSTCRGPGDDDDQAGPFLMLDNKVYFQTHDNTPALIGTSVTACPMPNNEGLCRAMNGPRGAEPTDGVACLAGTYTNLADTASEWRWRCTAINGAADETCSAAKCTPDGSAPGAFACCNADTDGNGFCGVQGGGGGGGGCFAAGTMIKLADGGTKPIDQIKKGDVVLSFDLKDVTGKLVPNKVAATVSFEDQKVIRINDRFTVTPSHKFPLADNSVIEAGDLKVGDTLVAEDGNVVTIEKIDVLADTQRVYNFEVENNHSYVVEGIRTNNMVLRPETIDSLRKVPGLLEKVKMCVNCDFGDVNAN